jgi:hypothetical protein
MLFMALQLYLWRAATVSSTLLLHELLMLYQQYLNGSVIYGTGLLFMALQP